eukprot:g7694.t2
MEKSESQEQSQHVQIGTPFSLNFQIALNEERNTTTTTVARSTRWKALSNVSFHVELVSSSVEGSFSSEITTKSRTSFMESPAPGLRPHPTPKHSMEDHQDALGDHTSHRRWQSAPGSMEEVPLQGGGVTDDSMRRHSMDNCDEREVLGGGANQKQFGTFMMSGDVYSNAFHTSKTKGKKMGKPPRIPSFKTTTTNKNEIEQLQGLTHGHQMQCESARGILPPRQNSKIAKLGKELNNDIHFLPQTSVVNGDGVLTTEEELDFEIHDLSKASGNQRNKESLIKRLLSVFFKCLCSDSKTDEQEAERYIRPADI